jgi:uncharacterized lipoprotein YmbA
MRTKLILHAVTSLVVLASVVLLVACSSPAPEPSYYLMRTKDSEATGRVEGPLRAGLGRIIVAPYLLSSPGIVLETASGEVRAARHHRWAEPLDAGLRWYLRSEIARQFGFDVGGGLIDRGDWDYTIDVFVAQLHGTMSGTAILVAAYAIRPTDTAKPPLEFRFTSSKPLSGESYAALVEAELSLVGELGQSIATSLKELTASQDEAEANPSP